MIPIEDRRKGGKLGILTITDSQESSGLEHLNTRIGKYSQNSRKIYFGEDLRRDKWLTGDNLCISGGMSEITLPNDSDFLVTRAKIWIFYLPSTPKDTLLVIFEIFIWDIAYGCEL